MVSLRTNIGNTSSIGTTGNFTNQDVNGLLSGYAWTVGTITYSFPGYASNYGSYNGYYYGSHEPYYGFHPFTSTEQAVARYALGLISQYTPLRFSQITETNSTHAIIRFGQSNVPPTSWAYYPSTDPEGSDVWLGPSAQGTPVKGSYEFYTILHEIGHTLGLKHGHENDGVHGTLPSSHNSTEWSLMTYHSYIGGGSTYTNSDGSGPQTYMIDDIAALQYLYGANYNTNSGDTVYSWNSTTGAEYINGVSQGTPSANKIYDAIWDGGGIDTYKLSNYTTNLKIDLIPGDWSTFSTAQLANLNEAHPGSHLAHGNVANAYLHSNHTGSLIENAIGGSGNDSLTGNQASNTLTGNSGNDTETGNTGNDTLNGGGGGDTLNGGPGNDTLNGGPGTDKLNGGPGNDILWGNADADSFNFDPGFGRDTIEDFHPTGTGHDKINIATSVFANYTAVKSHMTQHGSDVIIKLDDANSITVKNVQLASLTQTDFAFHTAPSAAPAAAPAAAPVETMSAENTDAGTPLHQLWAEHAAQANLHFHWV